MRETILRRRASIFRRLIYMPLFAALALVLTSALTGPASACLSWTTATLCTAVLELIGSYYIAGLAVSVAIWVRFGPFDRLLMLRLGALGIAGATASITSATQFLAERCFR